MLGRRFWLSAAALVFALLAQAPTGAAAGSAPVLTASLDGEIDPATATYVGQAVQRAESERAAALVLVLNTPGGISSSMDEMDSRLLNARVPVIVYVSPAGARADSAGLFVAQAADVVAMAPGTNIGSAHPIQAGGANIGGELEQKVVNDAVARIRSLAGSHGRNADWCERAVRESVNVGADQAVELHVADLQARDLPALLAAVDGQEVVTGAGKVVLRTKGAPLKETPMGWRLEALKALSDPNIAFILMTIGTIGLIAELYNPGAILPGIVGAISLILAFYSLQTLPINYAGVLLIILGIVLFILEIKVVSYGLLSLGGIAAMTLGALLLVKTDVPFMKVSLSVILPTVVTFGALLLTITWLAVKSRMRRPVTGAESMIGTIAVAKTDVAPRGKVFLQGELWDAVSEEPIQEGEEAEVKAVAGLTLTVGPRRK